jgi:uncharacterized membrane protein YphA (DoxX/SURF4 family)
MRSGAIHHVDYVAPDEAAREAVALFVTVLNDPVAVTLLTAGAVVGVAGLLLSPRLTRVPDVAVARRTLASYRPYLPWMLRLSLGLPLVGAGFAGYLISPAVPVSARVLQVAIGFLLLFGLATRLVAAVGLGVYLVALAFYPQLVLASEYVGGFLAIVLLGPGQPSADGLLRRMTLTEGTLANRLDLGRLRADTLLGRLDLGPDAATLAIRLALGLNFVYLGLTQKLLNGAEALAVVAKYDLTGLVPVSAELWVVGAGLAEIGVGLLLLLGIATRGVAAVAFTLFTLTLFGLPDDPVLAHVSLFGLASALMVTGSGPYALSVSTLLDRVRTRTPTGRLDSERT